MLHRQGIINAEASAHASNIIDASSTLPEIITIVRWAHRSVIARVCSHSAAGGAVFLRKRWKKRLTLAINESQCTFAAVVCRREESKPHLLLYRRLLGLCWLLIHKQRRSRHHHGQYRCQQKNLACGDALQQCPCNKSGHDGNTKCRRTCIHRSGDVRVTVADLSLIKLPAAMHACLSNRTMSEFCCKSEKQAHQSPSALCD